MSHPVFALRPEQDVMEALEGLIHRGYSGAPVTDESGRLVGVLSEQDCLRVMSGAAFHATPEGHVCDNMSRGVETITPELALDLDRRWTEIQDARAAKLAEEQAKRAAVPPVAKPQPKPERVPKVVLEPDPYVVRLEKRVAELEAEIASRTPSNAEGDAQRWRDIAKVARDADPRPGPDMADADLVDVIASALKHYPKLVRRVNELEDEAGADGALIIAADAALSKAGVSGGPSACSDRNLTLAERIALLAERAGEDASAAADAASAALESIADMVKGALPDDVLDLPLPDLLRLLIRERDEASVQRNALSELCNALDVALENAGVPRISLGGTTRTRSLVERLASVLSDLDESRLQREALREAADRLTQDLSAAKARMEEEIEHGTAEHQERVRLHVALCAFADAVRYKMPDHPDVAAWTPKALEDLCQHAMRLTSTTSPAPVVQEPVPLAPDSLLVAMLNAPDLRSTMTEALIAAYRAKVEHLDPAALATLLTGPVSQIQ